MIVVYFLGGYAGDLVTSVMDSTGCVVVPSGKISMPMERKIFKGSHIHTEEEKKFHYERLSKLYKSIPSLHIEYHLKEKHNVIAVTGTTKWAFKLAATRFINLHTPNAAKKIYNKETVEELAEYYEHESTKSLNLGVPVLFFEDIIAGSLLEKLKEFTDLPLDKTIYDVWLRHWKQ